MSALPAPAEVVAAGRLADIAFARALVGAPLPPLARRRRRGEPLRIVYLMPRTGVGGGARVLLEHANHLVAHGADVSVVSHFGRPDWFQLAAEFISVPFGQPLCQSVPSCDLIVAGYWDEILPARHLGIAPVVHFEQGDFHLYDTVPDEVLPLVEASLAAADWTIAVGDAAVNALADRYGVFARRILNAVDTTVFRPLDAPRDRRAVVFVGWDGNAFKGIDVARAVAKGLALSHPDVEAIWITPSPPVGAPFGETVIAPSQDSLARRLREAALYVGTSRYESFPLPPLEAMASGTPVVSTANAGYLSYGRDGDNCLLAPVDDLEALLRSARRVLDEPCLSRRLSEGGLATARSCSWEAITASLLEDFRALVEELPLAPAPELEVSLDALCFEDEAARARLVEIVEASPYACFAIPVSQPLPGSWRLVRWSTVARRRGGFEGTGRAHILARSEVPVTDATYQFGIDLLQEGLPEAAFSWFAGQCQQSPHSAQPVLFRWVLLALIEAGRASEALELAVRLAPANACHPDYLALALRAALAAGKKIETGPVLEAMRLLGSGGYFDEWLEAPADLLAAP